MLFLSIDFCIFRYFNFRNILIISIYVSSFPKSSSFVKIFFCAFSTNYDLQYIISMNYILEFTPLNCLTNKTEYLKNQSTTSITLRLSSFGNRTDLCLRRQPDDGMHSCKPLDTSSDMTISDLDPGSLYSFSVESIKNDTGGNHSCFLGLFHTRNSFSFFFTQFQ